MHNLLTLKEGCDFVRLSRATIYRHISHGDFPKPIKLTSRASRWALRDVERWIEKCQNQELPNH